MSIEDISPKATNPYQPPRARDEPRETANSRELASRWRRLAGAFFDGALGMAVNAPVFIFVPFDEWMGYAQAGKPFSLYTETGAPGVVAAAMGVGTAVANWYLLTTRGQTFGKIVAKTRVVTVVGAPAGFVRAVLIRSWTVSSLVWIGQLLGPLAFVSNLLAIINVLLIFNRERRCGHDILAGTKVVLVRPQRPKSGGTTRKKRKRRIERRDSEGNQHGLREVTVQQT